MRDASFRAIIATSWRHGKLAGSMPNSKLQLILAGAAFLAVGEIATLARATVIDVNFTGNGGANVGSTAAAGAPGAADQTAYWNNLTNENGTGGFSATFPYKDSDDTVNGVTGTGSTPASMVTDTGVQTSMNVTSYVAFTANDLMTSANGSTAEDLHLFDGGVGSSTVGTETFTNVTASLNASSYTVYVYVGSGTSTGHTETISDGATTFAYTSETTNSSFAFPGYTQSTTDNTITPTSADYVVFTNETASTLTLSTGSLSSTGSDIFAVQFVSATPEPTSLGVLALSGIGLLGRRRARRAD